MKSIRNPFLVLTIVFLIITTNVWAQKPALDIDDLDSWKKISNVQISSDGGVYTYEVLPQVGDGVLTIVSNRRKIEIPRGCKAVLPTDSGRYLWFKIKASKSSTASKSNKVKKQDKDSLGCLDLKKFIVTKYPRMESFSVGASKFGNCAYLTSYKCKDSKGKTVTRKAMVVPYPGKEKADTVKHMRYFRFSPDGEKIVAVKSASSSGKRSAGVYLFDVVSRESKKIKNGFAYCKSPAFSADGRQIVFLATNNKNKKEDRECSIYIYDGYDCKEVIPQGFRFENFPENWTVNQNSRPFFSQDGGKLYFGVAPCLSEDEIAKEDVSSVDIWRYDADLTPVEEKFYYKDLLTKTYLAVLDLQSASKKSKASKKEHNAGKAQKAVLLTENPNDRIVLLGAGNSNYALSIDRGPYMISETWSFAKEKDLYLVNLNDGSRKSIWDDFKGFVGVSPKGKYVILFNLDDGNYYSHRVADGKRVCLTANLGVNFFDETGDRPHSPFPYNLKRIFTDDYLAPLYTDNEELLVNDRYDLWKINLDGKKALNITEGVGRKNKVRFRYLDVSGDKLSSDEKCRDFQPTISLGSEIYLNAFQEGTMETGLGKVKLPKDDDVETPYYLLFDKTFTNVAIAENGLTLFCMGDFENCYDLYSTGDFFDSWNRLTNINPQQSEYRWGSAHQVHWTAYDGTPLTGILYVPEGVSVEAYSSDALQGEKLPMVCYFYERKSETLYDYLTPNLSRSRVNVPYFCSNGYVVFTPDIVYETGHPGKSAFNCIVSGAEAMCRQFSFIDKENVALQGQSWGGYQTAYIITQTDKFKAAGAGAPVSNMTSAYGAFRLENGIVRIWQYEHDQSRIGRSLWDEGGLDLYIENSPLFYADKIHTPLLMTSNDADDKVPWFQGVELFYAMRRLQKPVWMLQYNNEVHNLKHRNNRRDLTKRMMQFFDYYLKGAPMPAWMKSGVPIVKKGKYLGFEPAIDKK